MNNEFLAQKKVSMKIEIENSKLPDTSADTLNHVLNIMDKLVTWLVSSGVGHNDFSNALRKIFYNQAIRELEKIHQKKTDSLISLLSGLDRRDVRALRDKNGEHKIIKHAGIETTISVPARVIGLWIHLNLPERLPFSHEEQSFEKLVKEISSEKHPRSILLELIRLGLVTEEDNFVRFNSNSFTPSKKENEIKTIFSSNIHDHLSVGLKNLDSERDFFLEQAVFAEELSEESIKILKEYSKELWSEMSVKILNKAIECSKNDHSKSDANKRFKLGVYQYDNVYLDK